MAKEAVKDADESSIPSGGDGAAPKEKKGFMAETKEFVKAILWAFAIAVFLRSFVVEAYKIPSGSMLPTLSVGDHIFVNKFIYGLMIPGTTTKFFMFRDPKRGEVIVFKYPNEPGKDYIKRVIGVPGDTIDIREDVLYINGKAQNVSFDKDVEVVDKGCYPEKFKQYRESLDTGIKHPVIHQLGRPAETVSTSYTVPEGHLFVMGDNRDNSQDSRTGFTVPMSYVKGRAMFVWLSWDSCGTWWPFTKIRGSRFGEGVK